MTEGRREGEAPGSGGFWVLWYGLGAALLLLGPSRLTLNEPIWSVDRALLAQVAGLALALLLTGVVLVVARLMGLRIDLLGALIVACFALLAYCLTLLLVEASVSRRLLVSGSFLYLCLVAAPILLAGRYLGLGTGGLAAANLAVLALGAPEVRATTETGVLLTAYHAVRVTFYEGLIENPIVGGGIAQFGEDQLVASGDGALYQVRWPGNGLAVDRLLLRVPINRAEFTSDTGILPEDRFRVAGLLTQELGDSARVLASHHFWKHDQQCFVLRVSTIVLSPNDISTLEAETGWETLYETRPCLPINSGRLSWVAIGSGGRMVPLGNSGILLTVGDHGFDGLTSPLPLAQLADNDYGKILEISLETGRAEPFTVGHRNPQGLALSPTGELWSTKHGPQGGDELNIVIAGENYGWPWQTYGTASNGLSWPLRDRGAAEGAVDAPRGPEFAWVPSIGASNLIVLDGPQFPRWNGDLLVASLSGQSLHRLHLEDGQVVLDERIRIGRRIRDLIEEDDRILLFADDGALITLTRAELDEGLTVLSRCASCHPIDGPEHGVGPSLMGIWGRPIGSARGYRYSEAVASLDGSWTEDLLHRFLADPASVAPGTFMVFEGLSDASERQVLIDYLRTLD